MNWFGRYREIPHFFPKFMYACLALIICSSRNKSFLFLSLGSEDLGFKLIAEQVSSSFLVSDWLFPFSRG